MKKIFSPETPPVPEFDAAAYLQGLLGFGDYIFNEIARLHQNSLGLMYHQADDSSGPWDVARLQSVMDAAADGVGPQLFGASALLGYVVLLGNLSESDPTLLPAAAQAIAAALEPLIGSEAVATVQSPVPYDQTAAAAGRIVFDPNAEYPGPAAADPPSPVTV